MFHKILIKNIDIIDGLGNEPFQGSVLIDKDRICKIYKSKTSLPQVEKSGKSLQIIDGNGKVINVQGEGVVGEFCFDMNYY